MFASHIKKNKFSIDCSPSFKLTIQKDFFSLMEVIAFGNSFYEAQVIDVAFLYENTHHKHFVSGDTTGPLVVL